MSEGQEARDIEVDEDQGMDALSPAMSYDPGSDHLDVISEGEPKYEGKGKGRSESFSHLPPPVPSVPSTAPSTRPNSDIPDASAASTAPSTRPTSEIPGTSSATEQKHDSAGIAAQGAPGPNTDQAESAAMATQGDPGPSTDQAESAAVATQGDSGPSIDQAESVAMAPTMATQDDPGPCTGAAALAAAMAAGTAARNDLLDRAESAVRKANMAFERDVGCSMDQAESGDPGPSTGQAGSAVGATQGDSGPSIDQAESVAMATQSDPGPSTGQAESAAMAIQGDSEPVTGQGESASATGQGSEPAIEPTGPPNSLTTIPTAKYKPLKKKSTDQVSIAKESGPKAAGPSNPPQADEGASGSQANQPQKLDAVDGQDLESKIPKEEQEKATTEPRRVELGGTEEFPDTTRRSDEDDGILPTLPPVAPLNSPHHRHDIAPKSILKKTVGTEAEARLAEEEEQFGRDGVSEAKDPGRGTKLLRQTIAKWKADCMARRAQADAVSRLNTESPSEAGTPRLNIELNAISGGDNDGTDGESSDGGRKFCRSCCIGCTLL